MNELDPVATAFADVLGQLGSDHSRRAYEQDWNRYTIWLGQQGVTVTEARPRHVVAHVNWMREQKLSRATIGRALSVLREIYAALVRDEVVETNPAREVKKPKMDSTPKAPVLDEEEIARLLNLPAETWHELRDQLCIRLLFGLGWRRAEIARMRADDFGRESVTGIFKGNKENTVGVPEWLLADITEWRRYAGIESGPLLPRSQDKLDEGISADMVYKIVKKAAARAGLPIERVTPHGMRRTTITLGRARGVDLKALQLAVGHSSQSTTERYDRARSAAKSAPGQVFADLVKKQS